MKRTDNTTKYRGSVLALLFFTIIATGFCFALVHFKEIALDFGEGLFGAIRGDCAISDVPASLENKYNSLYSGNHWCLDTFSLTQRALGKHETRNFEVLKSNNGALYLKGTEEELDVEKLQIMADECELLYNATIENGGVFLYVQAPYKNVGQVSELSDYSSDITEDSEDYLDNLICRKGIPVLDLRNYNECMGYYNTDHHWTMLSAFNASKIIEGEINRRYGIGLDDNGYYGSLANYDSVTYNNCFLGSIGIKVGPYFVGKDTITVYNPKFDTDFVFKHYINNELQFEYTGDFWKVFIDQELLDDSAYNNKYDAILHGAYVESVIINKIAKNEYKGLLVAHSYGRPMAQYMSLGYKEFRYLDPQPGRYNDNLLDYISEYKPDVVIYMFNGIVNVGDGNW